MTGRRRALLVVLLVPVLLPGPGAGGARSQEPPSPLAVLVLLPPMAYEEALEWAPLAELAAAGGVGLMTTRPAPDRTAEETLVDGGAEPGALRGAVAASGAPPGALTVAEVGDPGALERLLDRLLASGPDGPEVLVVAAPPSPSAAMEDRGDAVTPLFAARGAPHDLVAADGPIRGLTSATTRREGLVANLDVAPTILASLGAGIPAEMAGSPVEAQGPAPALLHQRYLAVRQLRLPVQLGMLAVGLGVLVAGGIFLVAGGRSSATARALAVGGLVAATMPAAVLPAGDLPRIAWGTVLPVVAVLVALIVGAAVWLGRRDPTIPVAVVGAASLSILALDALWGWRAQMMPLIGGTALEGARFFGLGNVYAGVLLGGAVVTAAHLPPRGGVGLLAGAALFAGLPGMGANFGAAVTLFAAAGLWYGLRVRRRLGWPEVAVAAAVTVLGAVVVVGIHAVLAPGATHVARLAEEATSTGIPAVLDALGRRVAIGIDVLSRFPPAWLLLAALPAVVVLGWRRWGYLRRDPAWRDAVVVLGIAGLVGLVANDTGIGVGGLAFAFAVLALGYPSLEERWTSG